MHVNLQILLARPTCGQSNIEFNFDSNSFHNVLLTLPTAQQKNQYPRHMLANYRILLHVSTNLSRNVRILFWSDLQRRRLHLPALPAAYNVRKISRLEELNRAGLTYPFGSLARLWSPKKQQLKAKTARKTESSQICNHLTTPLYNCYKKSIYAGKVSLLCTAAS